MTITANDHPYRVTAVEGSAKYANNHPIKVEIEGGVVTPDEFDELEKKVDALSTDLSYKGGVEDYDHLPSNPAQGDVYTTEDTGVLWVWDGTQWVALNDTGSNTIVANTAPTISTEGEVGQLYLDTTAGKLYVLKAIDDTSTPATYTWIAVGPTVVQTTGTSTTDVMSQNAVTSMVFADPSAKNRIQIGKASSASSTYSIAIGAQAISSHGSSIAIGGSIANNTYKTRATGDDAIAIGIRANATADDSVAIGRGARATVKGQFDIGQEEGGGYNNSNYRLLTGLYDPQSAHDAATKGYVDGTTESVTIADTDWSALSSSDPYTYSATKTLTATIGANSTVSLINDNAVSFGTYGFAIGAVDQPNNTITVYSIGSPSASVTLKINVKGA